MLERAHRQELPSELFPEKAPWDHFPWDVHCQPRSEAEEALRQAFGLREKERLAMLLDAAAERGLSKANSRVYFEALELKELLARRGRETSARSSAAHESAPSRTSGMLAPVREKTIDAKARLNTAIDVFLEDVITDVSVEPPQQKPFAQISAAEAAEFEGFMTSATTRRGARRSWRW